MSEIPPRNTKYKTQKAYPLQRKKVLRVYRIPKLCVFCAACISSSPDPCCLNRWLSWRGWRCSGSTDWGSGAAQSSHFLAVPSMIQRKKRGDVKRKLKTHPSENSINSMSTLFPQTSQSNTERHLGATFLEQLLDKQGIVEVSAFSLAFCFFGGDWWEESQFGWEPLCIQDKGNDFRKWPLKTNAALPTLCNYGGSIWCQGLMVKLAEEVEGRGAEKTIQDSYRNNVLGD